MPQMPKPTYATDQCTFGMAAGRVAVLMKKLWRNKIQSCCEMTAVLRCKIYRGAMSITWMYAQNKVNLKTEEHLMTLQKTVQWINKNSFINGDVSSSRETVHNGNKKMVNCWPGAAVQ